MVKKKLFCELTKIIVLSKPKFSMIKDKFICVAKTLTGLENPLTAELESMAFKEVKPIKRAVQFESDLRGVYMANLNLRTALSVLVNLSNFNFRNRESFYEKAYAIEWEKLFDIKKTFSIKAAVFGNSFDNTNFPALLVKDAIADRFRWKFGKRPNVDKERPDVVIDVYVSDNRCSISLNSSGIALFQRGYRNMSFIAPLNECLASGLVYLSGWKGDTDFINPMCGSGTLAIEAAMMALKVHPAKLREDFAFKNWNNYDEKLFEQCRRKLIKEEKSSLDVNIQASDLSNRAISITRNSLLKLNIDKYVDLFKMNFFKPKVKTKEGTIVLNPPYDERLKEEDITNMYEEIGRSLKFQYQDHDAWIFSSNIEALKSIGLKTSSKKDLFNGKLPCKYQGYHLYDGSKKNS